MKISHEPDTLYSELTHILRDLRFPSLCRRHLRSSELLHCVCWFVTDVSGHRIGHVLRGQDDHKDFVFLGRLDPCRCDQKCLGTSVTNEPTYPFLLQGSRCPRRKTHFIYLDQFFFPFFALISNQSTR